MAIYSLLESDSHLLKFPLEGVSEECDRQKLQDDLIETMKNFHGLGLSANQVGIQERVFVMYTKFEEREATACFNPKITHYGEAEVIMEEGCLSFPGLWLKVKRPYNIFVSYENVEGELIEEPMKDMEARIFQHEYDHMEGTDFTNRVSKLRIQMAKKRRDKQLKKSNRIKDLA
tara:strand:- start:3 stop:524 length:522 start_codon:yes stop_codon:yes gene_type:complete